MLDSHSCSFTSIFFLTNVLFICSKHIPGIKLQVTKWGWMCKNYQDKRSLSKDLKNFFVFCISCSRVLEFDHELCYRNGSFVAVDFLLVNNIISFPFLFLSSLNNYTACIYYKWLDNNLGIISPKKICLNILFHVY